MGKMMMSRRTLLLLCVSTILLSLGTTFLGRLVLLAVDERHTGVLWTNTFSAGSPGAVMQLTHLLMSCSPDLFDLSRLYLTLTGMTGRERIDDETTCAGEGEIRLPLDLFEETSLQ